VSTWLDAVANSPDDFTPVAGAIAHFDRLYEDIRKHFNVGGKVIIDVGWKIAGLSDTVYASWSELKAIAQLVDLRRDVAEGKARYKYVEHYNRQLSVAQVEKYARVDPDVVAIEEISIHLKFITDKWEGLSKGIERLHHNIRMIADMRRAGMDDATI